MRAYAWARTLLIAAYGLVIAGLIGWRTAVDASPDPTPVSALLAIWLASGAVVAATWWQWRRPATDPLPAAVGLAVTAPLAMEPIVGIGSHTAIGLGLLVTTVAMAPLAWVLAQEPREEGAGRTVRLATMACLGCALLVAGLTIGGTLQRRLELLGTTELWWVLVSAGLTIAASAAARHTLRRSREGRSAAIVAALGYVAVAFTVSVSGLALLVGWWPSLILPALAVVATVVVLGRFAIGPLTAAVGEVRAERDLVVSTLEAERSRIATTIHDGPLGDLALLVQRLDASGDAEAAAVARSIASELRALGNELRLPILEDLGAGPAIEWLAGRVSDRTHVPIRIDTRSAQGRPPAPVELAIFRIAQEALINSAKHGRGPITVRYSAESATAELAVTDTGPGISASARDRALGDGHLGLRLMAQRAEAIGARLEIGAIRDGGTRVRLEWTAA